MSTSIAPRLITELDEEYKAKINDICDFVTAHKTQIASQYQRWYSPKEAAAYIKVSKSTLLNKLRTKLPPIQNGRNLVYDREDLDSYWEKIKAARQHEN